MKSSSNPSLQCTVCGQWKRLHGIDEKGLTIQRFYSCCMDHLGKIYEHEKDVCEECCRKNCPYRKTKRDE